MPSQSTVWLHPWCLFQTQNQTASNYLVMDQLTLSLTFTTLSGSWIPPDGDNKQTAWLHFSLYCV